MNKEQYLQELETLLINKKAINIYSILAFYSNELDTLSYDDFIKKYKTPEELSNKIIAEDNTIDAKEQFEPSLASSIFTYDKNTTNSSNQFLIIVIIIAALSIPYRKNFFNGFNVRLFKSHNDILELGLSILVVFLIVTFIKKSKKK